MNYDKSVLAVLIPEVINEMIADDPTIITDPSLFVTFMMTYIVEFNDEAENETSSLVDTINKIILGKLKELVESGTTTQEFYDAVVEGVDGSENKISVILANRAYEKRRVRLYPITTIHNDELETIQALIVSGDANTDEYIDAFRDVFIQRYFRDNMEMSGLIRYQPNNLYNLESDTITSFSSIGNVGYDYRNSRNNRSIVALANNICTLLDYISESANIGTPSDKSYVSAAQRVSLIRTLSVFEGNRDMSAAARNVIKNLDRSYASLRKDRKRIVRTVFDRILKDQPLFAELAQAADDLSLAFNDHLTLINNEFSELVELANTKDFKIEDALRK